MTDLENKQNESVDNTQDQLKQNFDYIQNEISQLTNTDSTDDKIEGVDGMLTTAFADYLKKQDVKLVYALYSNVNNIIENSNGNIDPNLQKLKNFLAPLVDSARLEGNMDDKLSDEEAKEYKGKVGRIENLQETKANLISSLEEKIKKLDGADDNLKKTLSNIKAVVEQPNTVNVKSLQKFILKNLSGEDREKFFNYNFKAGPDGRKSPDNPDGLFGQNLVDGINTFLQGLDGYIAQVESSKNIQSENDEISRKQAEQKEQEEARKLAEQQEKERINNLNMGKIIDSEDGKVIKSLSSSIKNQIDDIIEIENSEDDNKNGKLGEKLDKLDSKLKKKYMDLFVDKVKAMEKGKPVEEYDKQLKAILKFGSWKIRPEDGAIIDDTDNISDYRKYENKIGESIGSGSGDNDDNVNVPVEEIGKGDGDDDKENVDEDRGNVAENISSTGVDVIDYNMAQLFGYKETTIDQSMRDKLKIPNNVAVYTKDGDENAYHYRSGSDIIRVSTDESSDLGEGTKSIDAHSGVENTEGTEKINQLNSNLKEALNGLVDEGILNSLKIEEFTDGAGVRTVLTNGKVSVKIDDILSDGTTVCGKNTFQDKIKITYVALYVYSQTEFGNISAVSIKDDLLGIALGSSPILSDIRHEEFEGCSKFGITKDNYEGFLDFYNKTLTFSKVDNN